MTRRKYIIIATGGSGGHTVPASVIAKSILDRGYEVTMTTDLKGKNLFDDIFPKGANIITMRLKSFLVGKIHNKVIRILVAGLYSVRMVLSMIVKRPDLVISFGSYASFPTVLAGYLTGQNIVLHEQNAVLSNLNSFVLKLPKIKVKLFTSFKNTAGIPLNITQHNVGMPVRKEFLKIKSKDRNENDDFNILIVAGSQNSRFFMNDLVKLIAGITPNLRGKIHIRQAMKVDSRPIAKNIYNKAKVDVKFYEFFYDMPKQFQWADLIIARAGAGIFEIVASKRTAVIIPISKSFGNHQKLNASQIHKINGSAIFYEDTITQKVFNETMKKLLNHEKLKTIGNKTFDKIGHLVVDNFDKYLDL
ncbi:MAG: UDP-N-acetylglucosamine--N-acetylmuramyl-(pentapeptide) pyrophosphoryl-undecaprenol N-acetylglucosamine transferase [Alphaproteobacteria bacterium]|nr:UDP-N-acetylglucosamine--N-acetylmuramyl-(pentapeptide) pyrophosphoryl-undecaprenol N-acetylglucosamine transferase [Alphaproteobacteria bacterium]MBL0717853.1 UDP-N-acetylglucosamine--N-acetylmuramyl-(pentapeptide) pyrophosphoryl-undecaprenol N-acetylglucosamine transferase [Alphaproteobacteria bacterium]